MPQQEKNSAKDVLEGLGGAARIAGQMIAWPITVGPRSRWGASEAELSKSYPGDELISNPKVHFTHAISIYASQASVWPWVAQLGQGRGGFYSYQWLENLASCKIYNSDEILPEYQNINRETTIRLHPDMDPLPVHAVEAGKYFLLYGVSDMNMSEQRKDESELPDNFLRTTWLFYLEEVAPNHTRLISRWKADFKDTLLNRFAFGVPMTGSVSHVMDVKMLKGIKLAAEKQAN